VEEDLDLQRPPRADAVDCHRDSVDCLRRFVQLSAETGAAAKSPHGIWVVAGCLARHLEYRLRYEKANQLVLDALLHLSRTHNPALPPVRRATRMKS
jgi:hypothetical protein